MRGITILILSSLLLLVGCASMKTTCRYYEDGVLQAYSLRSTVVGTGETEMISTDCAAIGYSTKDTGLSDNGKEALGEIAEGAVKGVIGKGIVGSWDSML